MDQKSKLLEAQKDLFGFKTDAGEHEMNAEISRHMVPDADDTSESNDTTDELTKLAKQNVAPFLTKYHPRQYAPLRSMDGTPEIPRPVNAGYCYRHQPDSKCRRQADEQSMRQLQRVCLSPLRTSSILSSLTQPRNSKHYLKVTSKASPTYGRSSPRPPQSSESSCYKES